MKFADPLFLLGSAFALVVAALFVLGGVGLVRAIKRFGDPERVGELVTARAGKRRAWKGVLVVLATALVFVAVARPQYGRGTRLIPATNLDVAIVLDFSKSMYAKDVTPSRIARAKAEVARLIHDLAGARFGAVAFAGEPITFPLTSDGPAIAQFFRQLEPNDMPVGGTAIARALERARELFARDPKSHDHRRVILLVTDGEDLEGDPVTVARAAGEEGTQVHVIQIGGRTPERIPEIQADGRVVGYRKDDQGNPLMTELSAEGETQLAQVASAGNGRIIRSERGETGIDKMAHELKRMMSQELAERVETVYADVYVYPLGLAILLLLLETFLGETKRRRAFLGAPLTLLLLLGLFSSSLSGCGWSPSRPFDRNAPEVDHALSAFDAGDAGPAAALLESYLSTGACADGGLGAPERVKERPNASFDLGLALFQIGERFGRRFGEEVVNGEGGPSPEEEALSEARSEQVECALRVVLAFASDDALPVELRARAQYLAGNLEFLRGQYEEAVRHYDEALKLVPGVADGGDQVGRDAAFNRAIALTRIEDEKKKDAGSDASHPPDASDGGEKSDAQEQPEGGSNRDGGSNDPDDKKKEAGAPDEKDAADPNQGKDGSAPDKEPPPEQNPPDKKSQEKPPPANQDERILDMLESAPTFQQQDAKNRAAARKVRGMDDK